MHPSRNASVKRPIVRLEAGGARARRGTYDRRLGTSVGIPARVPDNRSARAIYAVLLSDEASRTRVQAALREEGVPTATYYPGTMTAPACRCRTTWPGAS